VDDVDGFEGAHGVAPSAASCSSVGRASVGCSHFAM
jgi:hypothetical protein